MHTKDMLAGALWDVGLIEMAEAARGGYYHDFLSPLDTPTMQLVNDLAAYACRSPERSKEINALRQRVMNGDFDASSEESDEWAASAEGQAAFNLLTRR